MAIHVITLISSNGHKSSNWRSHFAYSTYLVSGAVRRWLPAPRSHERGYRAIPLIPLHSGYSAYSGSLGRIFPSPEDHPAFHHHPPIRSIRLIRSIRQFFIFSFGEGAAHLRNETHP